MQEKSFNQVWRPPTILEDKKMIKCYRKELAETRWYNFIRRRKLKDEIRYCNFRINLNSKKIK